MTVGRRDHRAVAVEFGHSGHYGNFMRHLVAAWAAGRPAGSRLGLALTADFIRIHDDVMAEIAAASDSGIEVIEIDRGTAAEIVTATTPEAIPMAWLNPPGPPAGSSSAIRWTACQKIAAEFGADRLLAMDIDLIMPSLAARAAALVGMSGAWFRVPSTSADDPPAQRRWALHQRALALKAFAHPRLLHILSLDPRLKHEAWARPFSAKVEDLPDPVARIPAIEPSERRRARGRLGLPEGRTVFLLFGQLSKRKGLAELFSAVAMLEQPIRSQMVLVLAGSRVTAETTTIEEDLESLSRLGVHVVFREGFQTEQEADDLFAACDVVLVTYRRHVGTSGNMLRAAAVARPVLAQADGLVGLLTRKHGLGATVDTGDPAALAAAISGLVGRDLFTLIDPAGREAFLDDHSPQVYGRAIMAALVGKPDA